jgi:hypothetical protein
MARTLEFYFDYSSPYSYLADTQVEAIARRTGGTLSFGSRDASEKDRRVSILIK